MRQNLTVVGMSLAVYAALLTPTPYDAARVQAITENKPLLTWCNQGIAWRLPGTVATELTMTGRGLSVAVPRGGQLKQIAWLPGTPDEATVRDMLGNWLPVTRPDVSIGIGVGIGFGCWHRHPHWRHRR